MRVAGVPGEISAMTLDEVRGADIGKKFSAAFVGEKVPTLAEVIALVRDRIKLEIELKYYDREGSRPRAGILPWTWSGWSSASTSSPSASSPRWTTKRSWKSAGTIPESTRLRLSRW